EEARRVQHLLHTRAALGAFVADDHHITGCDLLVEDAFDGGLLGLEHLGRAGEGPQLFLHTGGLDDRTVGGQVAEQHGQAAVLGVGVRDRADATLLPVGVQAVPAHALGVGLGGPFAT